MDDEFSPFSKLIQTALIDAEANLPEDVDMNALAEVVAHYVAGYQHLLGAKGLAILTLEESLTMDNLIKYGIDLFMLGYIAREENWIDREDWKKWDF